MAIMVRRSEPRSAIWDDGPPLFGFLADSDFAGPQATEDGIAYHRPGLHIEVRYFDGHQPEVVTSIRVVGPDGDDSRAAGLDCLFVACGCGVLQDVPGNAPNRRTVAKRIAQHAEALRKVLPHLLADDAGQLVARCQGRLLPDP